MCIRDRFSSPSNVSRVSNVVHGLSLAIDMGLDLSGNGSSETVYDEGDGNLAVG